MTNKSRGDESTRPAPASAKPASLPKTHTTHLFAKTRDERRNALTHAQIEHDVAAFEDAGGRIEVLGNTHTFKKLSPNTRQAAPKPPADASNAKTPEPNE